MSHALYKTVCGTGFLRLLVLHPYDSDHSSPIRCSLRISTFADEPVYEALSYNWGDPTPEHRILVDDQNFLVRTNLNRALHDLRTATHDRTLWVDALCINQDDDAEEKMYQIQQMDLVYTRASKVIAYLACPSALPPISTRSGQLFTDLGPEVSGSWAELLFAHEYWSRLWIVQEVSLAGYLFVQIGGTITIEWDMFLQNLSHLRQQCRESKIWKLCLEGNASIQKLSRLRRNRYGPDATLESLVESNRETQCKNTMDKIYALTGLANDYNNRKANHASLMHGRYNKSKSKLYVQVLEHFWTQRTVPFPSQFDRQYDRSMRLMRYSELLLDVLQQKVGSELPGQTGRVNSPQVVARAEVVGTVSSVLQHYSNIQEIKDHLLLNEVFSNISSPSHHRLSYLEQEVEMLTSDDVDRVCSNMTTSGQRSTVAVYGSGQWEACDMEWERMDLDAKRLGHLAGSAKKNTTESLVAVGETIRLFKTSDGLFGIGPSDLKQDDVICRFWEMEMDLCVILRKDDATRGEIFRVVGRVKILEKDTWTTHEYPPPNPRVMAIRMDIDMVRFLSY